MKRYPKYKDSGVKWIGEIPEHWEVKRLAMQFSENKTKNSDYEYQRACKFNYGRIVPKNEVGDVSELKETYIAYTKVKRNDIVINNLNLNYDFVSQRVAIVENDGIITSAYLTITPRKDVFASFYKWFFKAMDSKKLFHGMGTGIRLTLSYNELKKQQILVPPIEEQQAIVAYLDEKVGKIDRYISEKEKEIVALDELKQATIANAVTRGLDPNAPLKDSGIKWIGNIPQHWEVKRAKNMFVKMQRPVRPEDEVVTCFRDGQVTLRKNRRTEGFTESLKEIGYQGVRKGDLVIHQMDAFAGSIGVSDSDGKGTPVYHCCMPKGDYNNYYYCFVLREMARSGFIKSLYRGIRERSSDFRFDTFAAQWLPIPPRQEQDSIVNFVNERCDKINRMKDGIKSEIEKLKEYKQRLISDVVTGKVCVKGEK